LKCGFQKIICASKAPTSFSRKSKPAGLKDKTTRMNNRKNHKQVRRQTNHQTTDPKSTDSVFLLFSTAPFLNTIIDSCTNDAFAFVPIAQANPSAKAKEAHFSQRRDNIYESSSNLQTWKQ
jgi:hypothetical protein